SVLLREVGRRRIRGSGLLVPKDLRGASNRENGKSRKKSPHLQTPPPSTRFPLLGKPNFRDLIRRPSATDPGSWDARNSEKPASTIPAKHQPRLRTVSRLK